ncbi:MAG: hypothetical protein HY291_03820 [Planctomycetes bacterium]|nr:hypothetical protein [Planctomycetota bacterium]
MKEKGCASNSRWQSIVDLPTPNQRVHQIGKAIELKSKAAIPFLILALADNSKFTGDDNEPETHGTPICVAAIEALTEIEAIEAATELRKLNLATNNREIREKTYIALLKMNAISLVQAKQELFATQAGQWSFIYICFRLGLVDELCEMSKNKKLINHIREGAKNALKASLLQILNHSNPTPGRREWALAYLKRTGIKFRKRFLESYFE